MDREILAHGTRLSFGRDAHGDELMSSIRLNSRPPLDSIQYQELEIDLDPSKSPQLLNPPNIGLATTFWKDRSEVAMFSSCFVKISDSVFPSP